MSLLPANPRSINRRKGPLLLTTAVVAPWLITSAAYAQTPPPNEQQKKNQQQQQQQQKQQPPQQHVQPQRGQTPTTTQPQRQVNPQPQGRFLPPSSSGQRSGPPPTQQGSAPVFKGSPPKSSSATTDPNSGKGGTQRPPVKQATPQDFGSKGQPNQRFLPPSQGGQPGQSVKTLPKGSPTGPSTTTTTGPGTTPSGQFLPKGKSASPPVPLAAPSGGRGPVTAPGVAVSNRAVPPIAGPQRLDQVKEGRVKTVGPNGQTIIQEPGNRTIVKQGGNTFITRNETTTLKNFAPNAQTRQRSNGVVETVIVRPGGVKVYSEVDSHGRLLRRYRRDIYGREVVFVDNRRFYRNLAVGVGVGLLVGAAIVALAPPVVALPRERYIVDYEAASDEDLYEALTAPPIETLERAYSLDEIRYSEPLRARMRRIDLDGINFEFGSFEVTPDQYPKLERIARAMGRAIEANPAEVYFLEGHTDAVGSEEDNLSLSDRRAEAVARILVEHFNIPIENLVTQGYGEQYLKVQTQDPERANRRVTVRRITPMLSQQGGETEN